jgi:hypothetical protein
MSDVVIAPPQLSPAKRSRAATQELWLDRLARFPDSGLAPAQFCAIDAISLSTVNHDSHLQWPRRRLRSTMSAAALATPASLPFADNKAGRMIPCQGQQLGEALGHQQLYHQPGDDSSCLLPGPADLGQRRREWSGQKTTLSGTGRPEVGPNSAPRRPSENDVSADPNKPFPAISANLGANAQADGR